MKKMFLVIFFLLITIQVNAGTVYDIPYTGISSWKNDSLGWIPERGYGGMGGPAATNNMGSAFQFTLVNPMNINYLSIHAIVAGAEGQDYVNRMSWNYSLYTASIADPRGYSRTDNGFDGQTYSDQIPDVNSLFATHRVKLMNNNFDDKEFTDYRVPFKANLQPGTYWIAHENDYAGGGAWTGSISQRFGINNGDKLATIHNPEPATMALFGSGLIPFLFRRRKV